MARGHRQPKARAPALECRQQSRARAANQTGAAKGPSERVASVFGQATATKSLGFSLAYAISVFARWRQPNANCNMTQISFKFALKPTIRASLSICLELVAGPKRRFIVTLSATEQRKLARRDAHCFRRASRSSRVQIRVLASLDFRFRFRFSCSEAIGFGPSAARERRSIRLAELQWAPTQMRADDCAISTHIIHQLARRKRKSLRTTPNSARRRKMAAARVRSTRAARVLASVRRLRLRLSLRLSLKLS